MTVLSMPAPVKGNVVSPGAAAEPDAHAAEATAGTSAGEAIDVDAFVAAVVEVLDVAAVVAGAPEDEDEVATTVVVVAVTLVVPAAELAGTDDPLDEQDTPAHPTTTSATIRHQ